MTFHDTGGQAPPYALQPDTLDAIRHDLGWLIAAPQTALSDGFGPTLHDNADAVDLANLDRARSLHLRRQAMDAVDQLIALLDALDAATEDREPDQDGGDADDCDAEDDGTAEPSLGAPERHPEPPSPGYTAGWGRYVDRSRGVDQARWASGVAVHEEEEDDPGEDGGDLDDDGLWRGEGDGSDDELTLGWSANVSQLVLDPGTDDGDATAPERAGQGFLRCGPDDAEDDDPAERHDHGGCERGPDAWSFRLDAWIVQAVARVPVRSAEAARD